MLDLMKNPYLKNEDAGEEFIPTASLEIYDWISEAFKRPKDTHINRASSATLCPKRRWFTKEGIEGKPLTPRKQINFMLGDLSEKTMNYFVKQACVGPGKLYSEVNFGEVIGSFKFNGKEIEIYSQQDLEADMGGIKVTAHVDGWGRRVLDGQWELIEFKSASNFSFSSFKEHGAGDYLKQSTVNLSTTKAIELGAKEVRYFYLRKETGHIWDRLESFNQELYEEVVKEFKAANQKEEPEAPYKPVEQKFRGKPTGKLTLPWQCQYCPYSSKCFDYELEFKADQWGNHKPVYIVKG